VAVRDAAYELPLSSFPLGVRINFPLSRGPPTTRHYGSALLEIEMEIEDVIIAIHLPHVASGILYYYNDLPSTMSRQHCTSVLQKYFHWCSPGAETRKAEAALLALGLHPNNLLTAMKGLLLQPHPSFRYYIRYVPPPHLPRLCPHLKLEFVPYPNSVLLSAGGRTIAASPTLAPLHLGKSRGLVGCARGRGSASQYGCSHCTGGGSAVTLP